MEILGTGGSARKAHLPGVLAAMMVWAAAGTVSAQTAPPEGNSVDKAPSEAARRAALSPFRFILQNASAPVRRTTAAPAPAGAALAETRKPAAAPAVQQAAAQLAAPAPKPAAAPAVQAAEAASSAASAEAAIAALSRQATEPEPAPPRLEIIPVSTQEPRLPAALMRERPRGVVKVHFDIQPDGSVSQVQVISSTNHSLNRASIDAVKSWKFQPVDAVLTVETELDYKFDQ